MTPPDWLVQRGNALKLGPDGKTWYVLVDGEPHYSLQTVPVGDRYNCVVRQTINGRRIESTGVHATHDAAVLAGLDELRQALGWA